VHCAGNVWCGLSVTPIVITNCVAKWPGSVHDAHILRESALFADFEGQPKPLSGYFLDDSGYMLRDWLLTPVTNPRTASDQRFNDAHSITRATVERCIGVLKRRWHCLHDELRVAPAKACKIICACAAQQSDEAAASTPWLLPAWAAVPRLQQAVWAGTT